MKFGRGGASDNFHLRIANRFTELRLAIDLGEIRTAAAFRAALERDGRFRIDNPLVVEACRKAGLGHWLVGPPGE